MTAPRLNADPGTRIPDAYAGTVAEIAVFAHQGGWDELLLVGGPVMVFAGLLAIARRRALALAAERDGEPAED